MSIQLTPQLEGIIRDKVASGRYHNATEVLSEALHALDDAERVEELRTLLAEGNEQVERGEYEMWTPALRAAITREAHEMIAEGRAPDPDGLP